MAKINVTTQPGKDTVYIDVDDEITSIIDKVHASDGRIIALVLPKRATVLQSIVNMKLLKRSAERAKKQLVLITTEAGLLPLAGSVGVHVADSLQSKPEIPTAPTLSKNTNDDEALSLDDEPEEEFTAENAGDKPVGDLAKKSGKGLVITSGVETETPLAADLAAADAELKPGKKHNKKMMVPNFSKFRVRLMIAGAVFLALLVFIYAAIAILPKATVTISTNSQDVNSSINLSLDTTASSLDTGKSEVPATAVQQQKTYTKEVNTTGEQNNGDKAKGSIKMTATKCFPNIGSPDDIPAGTGVSKGDLTYITQSTAKFHQTGNNGVDCVYYSTNDVDIVAQNGGTTYNANNANFTVNGGIAATGSAAGGTDDITKVVSQKDIDGAKKQIDTKDPAIKEALSQQLNQNQLFPVGVTFKASDPTVSSSAQPGDKADKVTVTISITYSMFGASRANLVSLIKDDIGSQVDIEKQSILNDGLDSASFSIEDISDTVARLSMESTATVGPKIDKEAIKQQIAGRKAGEAKDEINQLPGVTDAKVELSPFWVGSVPKNTSKIVVQIDKATPSN